MGTRAKIPEENGKSESTIKACVSNARACARSTGGFWWFAYLPALEQEKNTRALSAAKRAEREWIDFSYVP